MRHNTLAPRVRHNRAFTLVELLVVMAIIGVLISLVFPSIPQLKERSRIPICGNNMRQLWNGMVAYSQDYGGRFPINEGGQRDSLNGAICWVEGYEQVETNGVLSITGGSLWRYINDIRVYRCPSYPNPDYKRSYSMLDMLSGQPMRYLQLSYEGVSQKRVEMFGGVRNNSLVPMISEENPPGFPPADGRIYINDGMLMRAGADRFGTYHVPDQENPLQGKCNVCFVDGHIELLTTAAADEAYLRHYREAPLQR